MSDYLHALVERARGEARTVRPLLAPRFAPAAQPEALDLDVEVAVPRQRPAPEVAPIRSAASPRAPGPSHVDPPQPAPRRVAMNSEPPVEVWRDAAPSAPEAVRAEDARSAQVPEAVEVEGARLLVERHVVEQPMRRASEPSGPFEITVERVSAPEPEVVAQPAVPTAAPAPLPAGVDMLEEIGATEPIEAETQTVVVSIGRIEVNAERAMSSPSPSPARTWAGPRLPLDDYLRERSGGRR